MSIIASTLGISWVRYGTGILDVSGRPCAELFMLNFLQWNLA
jgi:hypothetical protein